MFRMICISAIVVILLSSCEFEPPDLSIQERKIADSIYRETIKPLREEMDSTCQFMQDRLILVYRDSMLKAREAEIQKQLERIKNLEQ